MNEKYLDIIEKNKKELLMFTKKSVVLGNFRLLLAALSLVAATLAIINWFSILYTIFFVVFFIGFIFLSILHSEIFTKVGYHKGIIKICGDYLKRISGEWKDFNKSGKEFCDYNHNYTHDLDIFGEKSLYQFLNVTSTGYGQNQLKNDLQNPNYTKEEIEKRQKAIKELDENIDLSMDFQYYGSKIKESKDLKKVVDYVKQKDEFTKYSYLKLLLNILPFITIVSTIVFLSLNSLSFRIAAAFVMSFQLIIWAIFARKTLSYLANSEKIHYSLSDYSILYEILESTDFSSELLREIKGKLVSSEFSASKATKQLARIMGRIQARTSGILYIILNVLFLWDISCCFSLSAWTKKYGKSIEEWFVCLGNFESLLSFSILGGVLDKKCMAETVSKKHTYNAVNIGHPLISNKNRVCNSFILNKNITIISGSNMSGKTTFLRTLGINLVLAKNGCFVCANKMEFSNMKIVSSMRVSDDLMDGISTFYSELKKIKRILDVAEKSTETFFLIDEIFRGTNSSDRTAGANAVTKKLNALDVAGLLTTHDLKLCERTDFAIDNYNFSENYIDGSLNFDYKIREGIAKTTNGEYLMKMLGII